MNDFEMKDWERILADEEELQPMTGFSTRVMRAVREEVATTPPIAFPWARLLPGLLINAALLLGATVWLALQPDSAPLAPHFPVEWFSDPQVQGLFWAALAIVGSGALAWTISRWAAPRRPGFV